MGYKELIDDSIELKNKIINNKKKDELGLLDLLKIDHYDLWFFELDDKELEGLRNLEKNLINVIGVEDLTIYDDYVIDKILDKMVEITCSWFYREHVIILRVQLFIENNAFKIGVFTALDVKNLQAKNVYTWRGITPDKSVIKNIIAGIENNETLQTPT